MSTKYIYVGHAQGRFKPDNGGDMMPYYNMFVITPVSDFVSADYQASGWKAEKLKCVNAEVWKNIQIGETVELYFDSRNRVSLATSAGPGIDLTLASNMTAF